jgi:hypothetical protein
MAIKFALKSTDPKSAAANGKESPTKAKEQILPQVENDEAMEAAGETDLFESKSGGPKRKKKKA